LKDLREGYRQHLETYKNEVGRGKFAHSHRLIGIAFVAALTLYSAWWWVQGSWIALFVFPTAMWVFNVNSFHDASHFALTKYWWLNRLWTWTAPYFSSPLTWDFQHIISHHNHCNTEDDPDSRYFPRRPKVYWWAWVIKFCLMTLGLQLIIDTRAWILMQFHHTKMPPYATYRRRMIHLILRPLWWAFSFVWPFLFRYPEWGIMKCLIFAIVPWLIVGFSFGVFSQLSHLQDGCEPLEPPGQKWKWAVHQCATSVNYGGGPLFWFWFYWSGGLALQIEHHLFPGVNHCHLPRLTKLVSSLCKKHNIPYRQYPGVLEPLRTHIKYMSTPPNFDQPSPAKDLKNE